MDASAKFARPTSSETFYKNNLEILTKQNKDLKHKLDKTERENKSLKKSLYEMSVRYNLLLQPSGQKVKPFDVDAALVSDVADERTNMTHDRGVDVQSHTHVDLKARGDVRDNRLFHFKYELKGHQGSVYCVEFSPDGRLLASGSFDRSVCVWDMENPSREKLWRQTEHNELISNVGWSSDGQLLVSGSYDHTVKVWDVGASTVLSSYESSGFIQAVTFDPSDVNYVYFGTSHNRVCLCDMRQPETIKVLENNTMINTLYVYRDGSYVMTGDSEGNIKTWDIRKRGACVSEFLNDESKKPITHIHACKPLPGETEGRFLGVNSYDNTLRVYDRCSNQKQLSKPDQEPLGQLTLVHAMKGYKNKNWPIKSSFHLGKDYRFSNSAARDNSNIRTDTNNTSSTGFHRDYNVQETLVMATGNADRDGSFFIFDVGGLNGAAAELIQKVEGHTDRVYAVNFHPQDPLLASCSADFSIKLWAPKNIFQARD
eukprot:GILK01005984.1.p1 GENE.GILK01005984.1~~GILK01005984.1.p1  ORF type:complete len:508 (-),score=66.16 GILK01005984.1:60-1514(-)